MSEQIPHDVKVAEKLVPSNDYVVRLELHCVDASLVQIGLSLLPSQFKTKHLMEYVEIQIKKVEQENGQ
jgi:hypothetical protein